MDFCSTPEDIEQNRFHTISDFKWCVNCGGEVEFMWDGKIFGICPKLRKTPDAPLQMMLTGLKNGVIVPMRYWNISLTEID